MAEKATSLGQYGLLRTQLLAGIRGEFRQMIRTLSGGVELLHRQLIQDDIITLQSGQPRLEQMAQTLRQLDWMSSDLLDLADPGEEGVPHLQLADITRQMTIVASTVRQQLEAIHWQGELAVHLDEPLYASVNYSCLYSTCANLLANLLYYGRQGEVRLQITGQRKLELSVEGAFLPPAVRAVLESGCPHLEAADRSAVGIYGLLFAQLYCLAMNWQLDWQDRADGTWAVLTPPPLEVAVGGTQAYYSGEALEQSLCLQARTRVERAFLGMLF